MKHRILNCVLIIASLFATVELHAQINIRFNPQVQGRTLDGLAAVEIMNVNFGNARAYLVATVKESTTSQLVVQVRTPLFDLRNGINTIDRVTWSNSRFNFGKTQLAFQLQNTGRLGDGEFEYCFEVNIEDSKSPSLPQYYENCFVHQNQPMTPMFLIDPVDGDEFCNKRPNFLWQAPAPAPPDGRYRLILTEIGPKQDIAEALAYNKPVINQAGIPVNMLQYPSMAPDLQEGRRYAWQVTLHNATTVITKSEIWTFTVKCKEDEPPAATPSYRELKDKSEGDFYIADKLLHFSLYNPYGSSPLNYSIVAVAEPGKKIRGLPELQLLPGLNKYTIDLSEIKFFRYNKEYLLVVNLINNRKAELRFIYKTEQ